MLLHRWKCKICSFTDHRTCYIYSVQPVAALHLGEFSEFRDARTARAQELLYVSGWLVLQNNPTTMFYA